MVNADSTEPDVADDSIAYGRYDRFNFRPANSDTLRRLIDLNIPGSWIQDKSVLDIGTNTGLASILFSQNGAESVTSFDAREAYITELMSVVDRTDLNIHAFVGDFFDVLNGGERYDVVLCFEVIHWLVSQRAGSMNLVVRLLAGATKERLIIETPWSIAEPSIAGQTTLSTNDYTMESLIEELKIYFGKIEFMGFASYFKGQSGSRRVIISCSEPIAFVDVLTQIPGYRGNNRDIVGNDTVRFVDNGEGGIGLKKLESGSPLIALPPDLFNNLFAAFQAVPELAGPVPFKSGNFAIQTDGAWFVLQKWMGLPPGSVKIVRKKLTKDTTCQLIKDFSVSLQNMTEHLLPDLKATQFRGEFGSASAIERTKNFLNTGENEDKEVIALFDRIDPHIWNMGDKYFEVVSHGDLHAENIAFDLDGVPHLIDFGNMRLCPLYHDILWGALMLEIPSDMAIGAMEDLQKNRNIRDVGVLDIEFLIYAYAGWIAAVLNVLGGRPMHPETADYVHALGRNLRDLVQKLDEIVARRGQSVSPPSA